VQAEQDSFDVVANSFPAPEDCENLLPFTFSNTGSYKSSDWIHLTSDIGILALGDGLGPRQRRLMFRLIYRLSRYKQRLGELREAQVQMYELVAEHEVCLPLCMMTINLHSFVHLVPSILLAGPFPFWWMFPMEREIFCFRKSLRSFKNPEESILRSYVVREFSQFGNCS